jgi:hypothetical protein
MQVLGAFPIQMVREVFWGFRVLGFSGMGIEQSINAF